jgi:hypothetical protein
VDTQLQSYVSVADMSEGEFRGRVLASLDDLSRRMGRVEQGLDRMADHETRLRQLEQWRVREEQRKWLGYWNTLAMLAAAAAAAGNWVTLLIRLH